MSAREEMGENPSVAVARVVAGGERHRSSLDQADQGLARLLGQRPGGEALAPQSQLGRLDAHQADPLGAIDGALQHHRVAVYHLGDARPRIVVCERDRAGREKDREREHACEPALRGPSHAHDGA